jgi:hypothetical protein
MKYLAFVVAVTLFVIIIFIPIAVYLFNFGSATISSDPTAWGVLGDYFGGVLNPIISLASLCLLGYLTHLVSEQTNKATKNLFILERRMLAYDEIAKFIKPINSFMAKMDNIMSMVPVYNKLQPDQGIEHMITIYDELRELGQIFTEFHYTLFEFNVRYGHLFKYDFSSKEYERLLAESKRVGLMMSNLISDHKTVASLPDEQRSLEKLSELLFPVIVTIRKEVET